MLLPDGKGEQGKRHSTADHMTRQGLCSEQARWTFSKKLLHVTQQDHLAVNVC